METKIEYTDLGLIEYKKAWDFQDEQHQRIFGFRLNGDEGMPEGNLIFCEHPHVFTLGKSGEINNLLINEQFLKNINASYYKSNRGGDITYHGPGQIVGYPIFDLERMKLGVKQYVHTLEEGIIHTLGTYGLNAARLEGATGVWLDVGTKNVRKICAIGVRVSRGVTMHGFALNVNTDLKYFSYINPCGFIDKGVTSMEKELGQQLNFEEVKKALRTILAEVFSLQLVA